MRKGLKKFTVTYLGTYFDGGRIYGQKVRFAENEEAAQAKVQSYFDGQNDEPICNVSSVSKWKPSEHSDCDIYPYWE